MPSGSDSAQNHLTAADLGTLIMRGFAVYTLLRIIDLFALASIPNIFRDLTQGGATDLTAALYASIIMAYILAAAVLWGLSTRVGKKLAGNAADKTIPGISFQQSMALIIIVFGCFMLLEAISQLMAFRVSVWAHYKSTPQRPVGIDYDPLVNVIIYLAIAIMAFIGTQGITKSIVRLRSAGKDKSG